MFFMRKEVVEDLLWRDHLTRNVNQSAVYQVPRVIGTLVVPLHKILQKGGQVKAFSQIGRYLLCDVVVDRSQMIVVGVAVEMDEDLGAVALVDEGALEGLTGRGEAALQMNSGSFQSMEFCVEERFADANLADEKSSEK